MREVIVNTSPIQYLFQLGRLELPPTLYGHIVIPEAVVQELRRGRDFYLSRPMILSTN